MDISLRANVKDIERQLDGFAMRQMPFATARALTALAKDVERAEDSAIETTFTNPRTFTKNAVGIRPATKTSLTATVFVKDIQARYLAPSEFDEPQFLGQGRKIRTPVDIGTNASGDIPRGKIKALLARRDTFVGVVHGVNGVWQRVGPVKVGGKRRKGVVQAKPGQRLKLLIAFTRPVKIKPQLHYHDRAQKIVSANFNRRFGEALAKAIATSR